ncbi:inorganic phosphate transporter [Trueperella sp. HMSC08B05]|uniref:Inorganic phosphate transporter n=1 Tax=Trueperella bernardiae TaxID=59561 RepID=A0AAW6ZM86_9ACTO|nr:MULTISPECIES: inorganic phosphate transporter [Trueperella]MDK8602743.1 inorganic phosphate transporter [Trueperella bernardiae]OCW60636.1 inorganic phosphate transporter [Trueperella bernardiae]OFS72917.1 inorganic phosphate transporter [Trueperella sp. HMSC08B05]PKZ89341.1 inorganic phosphate transporter [Trueperella bernardiae]WIM07613.1 inorganic phosphate transporter [Trueperella bernardiae]
MDPVLALVIFVVVFAFVFDYTNGFHDAANAIATSVATRALTPRVALLMAAVMNFIGALLGTGVAETIGSGIVEVAPSDGISGLLVVIAGLVGAVVWNLTTWWFGLPSSSSHALIGGLAGAGLAAAFTVHWSVIGMKVIVPMFVSPFVGFGLAYLLMSLIRRTFQNATYKTTMKRFRVAQTVSAAAVALGHGLQDAQKTMGVIVIALVAGGYHEGSSVPLWVKLGAATAISLGTYSGGWRIMKTLGTKIADLNPAQGFAAEAVAASVLYTTAYFWHAPISTTHTITSSVMGVGATTRRSAVRWSTAGNIVGAWFITFPAAGLVAAAVSYVLHLFV